MVVSALFAWQDTERVDAVNAWLSERDHLVHASPSSPSQGQPSLEEGDACTSFSRPFFAAEDKLLHLVSNLRLLLAVCRCGLLGASRNIIWQQNWMMHLRVGKAIEHVRQNLRELWN